MTKKHTAANQRPLPLQGKHSDHRATQTPHGLIPGRPGQEVNSGGDAIFPPLRPDPPRPPRGESQPTRGQQTPSGKR